MNTESQRESRRPWLESSVMLGALVGSVLVHAAVVLSLKPAPITAAIPLPVLSVRLSGTAAQPERTHTPRNGTPTESRTPEPKQPPHPSTRALDPRSRTSPEIQPPINRGETLEPSATPAAVALVPVKPASQPKPASKPKATHQSREPVSEKAGQMSATSSVSSVAAMKSTRSTLTDQVTPAASAKSTEVTDLAALTDQAGRQAARYSVPGLKNRPPRYPRKARKLGLEGRVILRVRVDEHGNATSVMIAQSSGHDILDRAARKAIGRWRFLPAEQRGRSLASTIEIPVSFRLEDDA